MSYKIKVCGMRLPENIEEVKSLKPDLLGFIFYNKSKRYVGADYDPEIVRTLPSEIKKVGVFVNEDLETILGIKKQYSLDYLQLHGEESPEFCKKLKQEGCGLIKVFSVGNSFDMSSLKPYEPYCDYFLFDTKGDNYGGNGVAFNWELLKDYGSKIPFILSGGVGIENIEALNASVPSSLYAIDVNSKFEISPALKDIAKLKILFEKAGR